ncbi:MAG: glycosyltransferase [Sandaracinaceae bacterium]
MRATVVIPTYRRAARLRELLACLVHQDRDALARVVVCDDGSGDETESVARAYEARLPLEYAWQEDEGFRAGQARNLGIERAIGDVVIFVDDDVLVRPDFVTQHLRAHAEADAERSVAIGYRHRMFEQPGGIPELATILAAERDDRLVELDAPVTEHDSPWIYVYSCNFSVSLGGPELFFDAGFRGWGLEDTELGYRLHRAGYRIVEADEARVLHVEDPAPRDPFRCEIRELPPSYDTYVKNAVYFMDKHPEDEALRDFVRGDLRWYVLDEHGRWVKNGYANDVDFVIETCRAQLRQERPAIRESA